MLVEKTHPTLVTFKGTFLFGKFEVPKVDQKYQLEGETDSFQGSFVRIQEFPEPNKNQGNRNLPVVKRWQMHLDMCVVERLARVYST